MNIACCWPQDATSAKGLMIPGWIHSFSHCPFPGAELIAQYVGRLHRLHEGKTEVRVYDYADLNVPMLARMFDRRCAGYEAVGYTVLIPGSAVPGWPAEVLLPVDPQWKSEYAASVRRLVRDGVDAPLARLFVHVARKPDPGAKGVDRARSATEAFFYRRLETLPETAGRFRLNAELPIPFDGWGNMEVDLLCAEARLVIELDGGQHLASQDAYRRDRRKDALLQEHGYFVLRFLAEDVGTRLDMVLDAILRTLAHGEYAWEPKRLLIRIIMIRANRFHVVVVAMTWGVVRGEWLLNVA